MPLSEAKRNKLERQRREKVIGDDLFLDHVIAMSVAKYLATGEMDADFPEWYRLRNAEVK